MIKTQIIRNAIKCKLSGCIIESEYCHDYKQCRCGAVGVDGGHDYLRRTGRIEDIEELSVVKSVGISTEKN